MNIETLLIATGVVLLFLAYRKVKKLLDKFTEFIEDKNYIDEEAKKEHKYEKETFENWLVKNLEITKDKITELSDALTIENPAWGENSAASKKKENLIKLYSENLVEKEKLSQKDALCKAYFVINSFDGSVVDDISRDISFHAAMKSEEELLSSNFFKQEVEEKTKAIKPRELFEPLYIGIVNREYKKGDELLQNTRRSFESHSGQYGYEEYVEDMAIISKLEQLGIFEVKEEKISNSLQESQDRATLGVSHDASADEIKSAHVKLAKKYHPDNTSGNIDKFTEINLAYKNLSQKSEIKRTRSGHPFYILKEDNLQKLREIIFANAKQDSEFYNDTYFKHENPKNQRSELHKMPFHKIFEN